jgi:hypothetical protein
MRRPARVARPAIRAEGRTPPAAGSKADADGKGTPALPEEGAHDHLGDNRRGDVQSERPEEALDHGVMSDGAR